MSCLCVPDSMCTGEGGDDIMAAFVMAYNNYSLTGNNMHTKASERKLISYTIIQ